MNEPAFPHVNSDGRVNSNDGALTKLEYAAIEAMKGFCANPKLDEADAAKTAEFSVDFAKALLSALEDEK